MIFMVSCLIVAAVVVLPGFGIYMFTRELMETRRIMASIREQQKLAELYEATLRAMIVRQRVERETYLYYRWSHEGEGEEATQHSSRYEELQRDTFDNQGRIR